MERDNIILMPLLTRTYICLQCNPLKICLDPFFTYSVKVDSYEILPIENQ